MNYETYYAECLEKQKAANDAIKLVTKLQKAVVKETATGDVKAASRDSQALCEAFENAIAAMKAQQECVASFNAVEYISSGDFADHLVQAVKEAGVDIAGDYPNYDVFPFRLRVEAETGDLYLNRKKFPAIRPQYIAQKLSDDIQKVKKSSGSFNAQAFANEVEAAYDTVIAKTEKLVAGSNVELKIVYAAMVPPRFKAYYDMQAFTYDIAKLYNSNMEEGIVTKSGKCLRFGPIKNEKNNLRILDANDREQWFGTITFYRAE